MDFKKWYDKDIKTSLLGFGAMRLKTTNGEIDEEKGFALFDIAIKNGVNYYDTAMPYSDGKNEAFVGKALKRYPRDSYFLATKLSLFYLKTKDEVLAIIDKQLETLQTDYIDMYLVHAVNKDRIKTIKEWGILDILEQWKAEGKIRNIGFSFHDDYETFKEILNMYNWDFCQIQLNYMDTEIQQGIKGYYDLEERKIPVVVMEPVKGGKLANFHEDIEKIFKDYSDKSIASWALRWVASLPGVFVVLSGMNEESQLLDNLDNFSNFTPMNDKELKLVEDVKSALKNRIEVDCTNCRYCLPCTVGIAIPANFRIFNDYAMYRSEGDAKWHFQNLKNNTALLTECIECGKCILDCPQHIDIPTQLKRMANELTFLK